MSIHWPILRTLVAHPTSTVIVDDRRSYRGIDVLVAALHAAAAIKAVSNTQTVGVLLPTGGAFPIAALACWMLGKTIVPLNYFFKPDELQYVVDNCEADTIITAQALLDFMGSVPRGPKLIRMEDIAFTGFPEPLFPACPEDDDLAVVLYTSGTSGKPKGVTLTHGNLTTNVEQFRSAVGVVREDVMVGVLPQFQKFPGLTVLTLAPLTVGMKVVYTAKFVPGRIVRLIRDHHATIFVAIASMWGALLAAKDAAPPDFASLRLAVSGGEPLADAVAERVKERFGVLINEGYGLTETSPVTNFCQPLHYKRHSVGPSMPGLTQRVVDINTGETLGPDEDGEVQFRGPNVMHGYFKLPELTAAAFTDDGYFRTGDIGRIDQDGFLFITGRLKEMLIIGGENVFPREIEEVLNAHPSIGASGVIGVADPVRGELPVAFVELREGHALEVTALQAWCRERLAGYKVPKTILAVAALPRNAIGKILRRELKSLL